MQELKVLVINESTARSIITDTYSTVSLMACFFINYYFLGDATLIKIFIIGLFFFWLSSKTNKRIKRMTPGEALEYLKMREEERK